MCLVVLVCAVLPVLAMTTNRGASPAFYVLEFFCLILAVHQHSASGVAGQVVRDYRYVLLAYCMPLVAAVVSMIAHRHWTGTDTESALRFTLGMLLFLLGFQLISRRNLKLVFWGVFAAAVSAFVYVFYSVYPTFTRPDTEVYNVVSYSSLMMILIMLTAFSLRLRLTSRPGLERTVKWLVIIITFIGFMLAQTRTGWLAIPVYLVLGFIASGRFERPARAVGLLVLIVAIIAAIGASDSSLRARVAKGYHETVECAGIKNNTTNNSVCIRFQLWRAAWGMFEHNPIVGMGDSGLFNKRLEHKDKPEGVVSEFVVQNFGEPHNDMLHALSSFGILGGLGLIMIYLAPIWVFLSRLRRRYPDEVRTIAAMGASLCLGFVIYGVTEFMFRSMRTVGVYAVLVAWLLVLSDPAKYAREESTR